MALIRCVSSSDLQTLLGKTTTSAWLIGAYLVSKDCRVICVSSPEQHPDKHVMLFMMKNKVCFSELAETLFAYKQENLINIKGAFRDNINSSDAVDETIRYLDPYSSVINVGAPQGSHSIIFSVQLGEKVIIVSKYNIKTKEYTLEDREQICDVFLRTYECLQEAGVTLDVSYTTSGGDKHDGIPPALIPISN